jgi:ketosteroid isomerase-like protein
MREVEDTTRHCRSARGGAVPGVLRQSDPALPCKTKEGILKFMSEENVAIVRRGYDHYNRTGEPDYSIFDPDVVYDVSRRVFDPEVYRGHEGIREFAHLLREQWETIRIEPQDFIVAGDDVVVVPVRLVAVGKQSGAETTASAAHLWTLRDGKVIRQTTFQTKAEAIAAAGLPDQEIRADSS